MAARLVLLSGLGYPKQWFYSDSINHGFAEMLQVFLRSSNRNVTQRSENEFVVDFLRHVGTGGNRCFADIDVLQFRKTGKGRIS